MSSLPRMPPKVSWVSPSLAAIILTPEPHTQEHSFSSFPVYFSPWCSSAFNIISFNSLSPTATLEQRLYKSRYFSWFVLVWFVSLSLFMDCLFFFLNSVNSGAQAAQDSWRSPWPSFPNDDSSSVLPCLAKGTYLVSCSLLNYQGLGQCQAHSKPVNEFQESSSACLLFCIFCMEE